MKHKFISWMALLMGLTQILCPALAVEPHAPTVKVCSGYWDDGTLYAFTQFADEDLESQKASLLVNNAMIDESSPQSLAEAGATIHYMLLIDTSSSMSNYRYRISYLARAIFDSKQNVKVSVARFGTEFSIVSSDMTEWKEVSDVLNSLNYNSDGSDITGSVAMALESLGRDGYSAEGEMTNLVVITDGDPWYSDDPEEDQMLASQANEAAIRMMESYPEIVIHTYSFGEWDENPYSILSDSRGLHETDISALEMGAGLAAYADSMYLLKFRLPGYGDQAIITDEILVSIGRRFISLGAVRNIGSEPEPNTDPEVTEPTTECTEAPTDGDPEIGNEEETIPDEPTESVETSIPAETETTEGIAETTQPVETTEEEDSDDEQQGEKKRPQLCVLLVIGGVSSVLLFALILVLRKNAVRKKSVRMKIQLIAGRNVRLRNEYYLERELLIGSERNCDVQIPAFSASAVNARIFRQNQILYVEDIGMTEDVLLNGMRIFSSNRLRSGDEITIGNVTIRVLF